MPITRYDRNFFLLNPRLLRILREAPDPHLGMVEVADYFYELEPHRIWSRVAGVDCRNGSRRLAQFIEKGLGDGELAAPLRTWCLDFEGAHFRLRARTGSPPEAASALAVTPAEGVDFDGPDRQYWPYEELKALLGELASAPGPGTIPDAMEVAGLADVSGGAAGIQASRLEALPSADLTAARPDGLPEARLYDLCYLPTFMSCACLCTMEALRTVRPRRHHFGEPMELYVGFSREGGPVGYVATLG